ncbi:acetolactate synthase [Aaosphaeria arxii CBS 175.79]|uniref:Acetolactate synthase n=1 Tax=Aaosphaeria arxii CBS 175.79 TaxID=1450172 RepID=A0A6A5Y0G5_9PLEO|nr:acetolactate synthase [Aaosphaeria arxii CBS 175.79]KAF2018749.1 acetolactate synthase [Aaosphaeria arxii CBS 175.79]
MATDTVDVAINSLLAAGVKYVFGVPGAKIDSVFNALVDHKEIHLVVCRHEQNAAFIAGAVGKITGRPGVCIATSGPGTSNLVTGLVTATDEGAPMVAIVGSVKRSHMLKKTHQSLRAVELLTPVTKKAAGVTVENQVAEIMLDAFRVATAYPQGAAAVILPIDIMLTGVSKTTIPAFPSNAFLPPAYGLSPESTLQDAVSRIQAAKAPLLFLGMRSVEPDVVEAVRRFLEVHPMPVVETFQAAGAISKELVHLFYGRVGLFRNQPGDKLLCHSDLIITIGYDQAEYDADVWNTTNHFDIIHLDFTAADWGHYYAPKLELIGSPAQNLDSLQSKLSSVAKLQEKDEAKAILAELHTWKSSPHASLKPGLVHPLYFIRLLQQMMIESTTVACDIGSVYIWMCRYFYSYKPKTFLVSNVQQTLGVAMPWAIAASLCQSPPCSSKVISISGDGGFMYSSQELVTAVQQGCNMTHFIWNDGKYNMVEFQEVNKYGRSAGIELGGMDFVKFAEASGAKGFRVSDASELESVMKEALEYEGVCVVDVSIDYSHNLALMKQVSLDDIS